MKREERRGKDTNGDVKTAEKGEVNIREKKKRCVWLFMKKQKTI